MTIASTLLLYVGPGGLLSAIGTFVALVGAVALAVVGFVWYPLRRLFRRKRGDGATDDAESHGA